MRHWDWVEWLCYGFIGAMALVLVMLVAVLVFEAKESAKFQREAPGMTYQALVIKLGVPTDKEAFTDGTEIICWRKYHQATTTMVMSGKVMVPIHTPAYTSCWKAYLRNGVCVSMEAL